MGRGQQQQQFRDEERTTLYDYLIIVVVVGIAAILYRRFSGLLSDEATLP